MKDISKAAWIFNERPVDLPSFLRCIWLLWQHHSQLMLPERKVKGGKNSWNPNISRITLRMHMKI